MIGLVIRYQKIKFAVKCIEKLVKINEKRKKIKSSIKNVYCLQ